jgi:hypothetical protein
VPRVLRVDTSGISGLWFRDSVAGFRVEGKLQVKDLQCWIFGTMQAPTKSQTLKRALNLDTARSLQKSQIGKPWKTKNTRRNSND